MMRNAHKDLLNAIEIKPGELLIEQGIPGNDPRLGGESIDSLIGNDGKTVVRCISSSQSNGLFRKPSAGESSSPISKVFALSYNMKESEAIPKDVKIHEVPDFYFRYRSIYNHVSPLSTASH